MLQIVHTEWITHIALENYQKWQAKNTEYKQNKNNVYVCIGKPLWKYYLLKKLRILKNCSKTLPQKLYIVVNRDYLTFQRTSIFKETWVGNKNGYLNENRLYIQKQTHINRNLQVKIEGNSTKKNKNKQDLFCSTLLYLIETRCYKHIHTTLERARARDKHARVRASKQAQHTNTHWNKSNGTFKTTDVLLANTYHLFNSRRIFVTTATFSNISSSSYIWRYWTKKNSTFCRSKCISSCVSCFDVASEKKTKQTREMLNIRHFLLHTSSKTNTYIHFEVVVKQNTEKIHLKQKQTSCNRWM